MVGVPAVATSVAVEGLEITDGEGVLIADDPEAFVRETGRLLASDSTWRDVAGRGRTRFFAGTGVNPSRRGCSTPSSHSSMGPMGESRSGRPTGRVPRMS